MPASKEQDVNYTTRVYQYGAVPLGIFPKERIDALYKAKNLWNTLVEIHNTHSVDCDQSRRDADEEYGALSEQLEDMEVRVEKALDNKRNARMKARKLVFAEYYLMI